jgi:hypothetical protein
VLFKFEGGDEPRRHRVSNVIEFGSRQKTLTMGGTDAANLPHDIELESQDLEWRGLRDRQS